MCIIVNSQSSITITNDVEAQRLGEVGKLVLVRPCLLEVAHGTDMAQETTCVWL